MASKGIYLALAGGGAIFVWSGVKNKKWSSVLRNLISGQNPNSATSNSSDPFAASSTDLPSGSAAYNSSSALQKLWTSNGGAQNTAAFAAAVAEAESSGSATVTSQNPDGGINVGIWQLDTRGVGAGYSVAQLQNPNLNARITIAATDNGVNWQDWDDPVVNAVNHVYTPGSGIPIAGGSARG
jgi:hypothetical protein